MVIYQQDLFHMRQCAILTQTLHTAKLVLEDAVNYAYKASDVADIQRALASIKVAERSVQEDQVVEERKFQGLPSR